MPNKSNKERLASIETNVEYMKEDIKEIKETCKEIPHMKSVIGIFSMIISAVVAGITSYFIKHTS